MSNNDTEDGGTQKMQIGIDWQYRANPLDVAWFAGIMDGEGSLSLSRIKSKAYPDTAGFGLRLKVSNTSMTLMLKAQRVIEDICGIKYPIRKHSDVGGKRCFAIEPVKQRAVWLLCEAMLPFLTVKRTQAELAIAFCKSRKENRHHGMGYTSFETSCVTRMAELKAEEYTYVDAEGGVTTKRVAPENLDAEVQ